MEKIASFTVNHLDLLPGIYVSRKDTIGKEIITTFDLRFTRPNLEPVLNNAEIHTIEHLAATFLRNDSEIKDKVIYFGPMGCRTGFYFILAGDYVSSDIIDIMIRTFTFISEFEGEVPGATPRDCGNYLDMNLPLAKYIAKRYLEETLLKLTPSNLNYPS
ncbi:MAG: S-ribosylhomocysteine lyase [Lachnospiraceae bacterium]|nr:S-ribosylhomocysteine lyase [Lachnospiraceae bacterium]